MKYGLITEKSFIRNKLCYPGEVLAAYDGPFGAGIVPCNVDGVPLKEVKDLVKIGAYGIVSAGGGRWVVTDPQGNRCSEVFQRDPEDAAKAKAQAQALADQLNAGEAAPAAAPETEEEESGDLPDA
jgi:hypothetical protein